MISPFSSPPLSINKSACYTPRYISVSTHLLCHLCPFLSAVTDLGLCPSSPASLPPILPSQPALDIVTFRGSCKMCTTSRQRLAENSSVASHHTWSKPQTPFTSDKSPRHPVPGLASSVPRQPRYLYSTFHRLSFHSFLIAYLPHLNTSSLKRTGAVFVTMGSLTATHSGGRRIILNYE